MFIQKAGKARRLYIPSKLSLSLKKWLLEEKRDSGYTVFKQI